MGVFDQVQSRWMTHTARGWDRMWVEIAKKYGGTRCDHEGEAWEYMGSFSEDTGVTWTHEFRHRALPPRVERTYERVPALADDFDEQPASLTIPT